MFGPGELNDVENATVIVVVGHLSWFVPKPSVY
jgi:hypothetical protein